MRACGSARWHAALAGLAMALVAFSCGGGAEPDDDGATGGSGGSAAEEVIAAQVASFEMVAGRDQRFIVGLLGNRDPGLISFGTVDLQFDYLGTREQPVAPSGSGPRATATFRPIPGQRIDPAAAGPRLVQPSEGIGVYGVDAVRFDRPGFWQVTVSAQLGPATERASAAFEVLAEPELPFPGDPAPRTANPVAGAPGVPPAAVDSRARGGAPVPDPELHSTSVADAIAAGRPVMVVISTPVYCQSRFCGPITDSVQALAARFGDRMDFVHIEVWEDFQAQKLNPAAREWIVGRSGDAKEPWTYLVGRDGRIAARWDNVATDVELEQAVASLVG